MRLGPTEFYSVAKCSIEVREVNYCLLEGYRSFESVRHKALHQTKASLRLMFSCVKYIVTFTKHRGLQRQQRKMPILFSALDTKGGGKQRRTHPNSLTNFIWKNLKKNRGNKNSYDSCVHPGMEDQNRRGWGHSPHRSKRCASDPKTFIWKNLENCRGVKSIGTNPETSAYGFAGVIHA